MSGALSSRIVRHEYVQVYIAYNSILSTQNTAPNNKPEKKNRLHLTQLTFLFALNLFTSYSGDTMMQYVNKRMMR